MSDTTYATASHFSSIRMLLLDDTGEESSARRRGLPSPSSLTSLECTDRPSSLQHADNGGKIVVYEWGFRVFESRRDGWSEGPRSPIGTCLTQAVHPHQRREAGAAAPAGAPLPMFPTGSTRTHEQVPMLLR